MKNKMKGQKTATGKHGFGTSQKSVTHEGDGACGGKVGTGIPRNRKPSARGTTKGHGGKP